MTNQVDIKNSIYRAFCSGLETLSYDVSELRSVDICGNNFLQTSVIDAYFRHFNAILKSFSIRVDLPKPYEILDWGCGVGFHGECLRRLGFMVKSCDVSSALSIGQNYCLPSEQIDILTHDFLLPYEDNSFDAVTSFGVLEHVPNELLSLKEIFRVLRPGGMFFIFMLPRRFSYINQFAHIRGDFYHDRLYDKRTVLRILHDAGFHVGPLTCAQLLPRSRFKSSMLLENLDRKFSKLFGFIGTNFELIAIKPFGDIRFLVDKK